jgi:hypothetical protein
MAAAETVLIATFDRALARAVTAGLDVVPAS